MIMIKHLICTTKPYTGRIQSISRVPLVSMHLIRTVTQYTVVHIQALVPT